MVCWHLAHYVKIKAVLSVQHENSKKRKVRKKVSKCRSVAGSLPFLYIATKIPKDTIIKKLTSNEIHKIRIQRVQKRKSKKLHSWKSIFHVNVTSHKIG